MLKYDKVLENAHAPEVLVTTICIANYVYKMPNHPTFYFQKDPSKQILNLCL